MFRCWLAGSGERPQSVVYQKSEEPSSSTSHRVAVKSAHTSPSAKFFYLGLTWPPSTEERCLTVRTVLLRLCSCGGALHLCSVPRRNVLRSTIPGLDGTLRGRVDVWPWQWHKRPRL